MNTPATHEDHEKTTNPVPDKESDPQALPTEVGGVFISILSILTYHMQKSRKTNPIYHFYEVWPTNAHSEPGNKGDTHYKCRHGTTRHILTITARMKGSLNGEHLADVHC